MAFGGASFLIWKQNPKGRAASVTQGFCGKNMYQQEGVTDSKKFTNLKP